MVTNESNSPRSVASCQANDWVCAGKGLLIWGPSTVLLVAGDHWASARPWLWFSAFLVAGVACLANAARCGGGIGTSLARYSSLLLRTTRSLDSIWSP